jgi:hypothetical protein
MSDGMDGRCYRLALRAASTTGGAFSVPISTAQAASNAADAATVLAQPSTNLSSRVLQDIVLLRLSRSNLEAEHTFFMNEHAHQMRETLRPSFVARLHRACSGPE